MPISKPDLHLNNIMDDDSTGIFRPGEDLRRAIIHLISKSIDSVTTLFLISINKYPIY